MGSFARSFPIIRGFLRENGGDRNRKRIYRNLYRIFINYVDAAWVPSPGWSYFRCAALHGLDGVLPAHPSSALGVIPEQVLQRRRRAVRGL